MPPVGFPSQKHPGMLTQGVAPQKKSTTGTLAMKQQEKGRCEGACGKEQSCLNHTSRVLISDKSHIELF